MDVLFERVLGLLRRGLEMLFDCWQYKMLASGVSSLYCYFFGGAEAILVAVLGFIACDTLTKWVAISRRYLIDNGQPPETLTFSLMVCGFWYAWKPGYLTSTALKQCWGEKVFTYGILIVFAGLIGKLPQMTIAGTQVNTAISGGIYTCIAMTELFSITENLEEMGNKRLAQFKAMFCTLTNKVTGGNFSITVSNNEEEKKDV